MAKSLLGVAWQEETEKDPKRTWFRLLLDLGVLGALVCRIVANPKRSKEGSPDWLIFHSPLAGVEDVRLGALWDYKNPESGAEYRIGRIRLAALGVTELKGGAKLDLRLTDAEIGIRLSQIGERPSEKSPTHQLWRMTPRAKAKLPAPPTPGASTPELPGLALEPLEAAEAVEPDVLFEDDASEAA